MRKKLKTKPIWRTSWKRWKKLENMSDFWTFPKRKRTKLACIWFQKKHSLTNWMIIASGMMCSAHFKIQRNTSKLWLQCLSLRLFNIPLEKGTSSIKNPKINLLSAKRTIREVLSGTKSWLQWFKLYWSYMLCKSSPTFSWLPSQIT